MITRFLKSFTFAWQGLVYTFKTQGNFKFHCFAALVALFLAYMLGVSCVEWLFIVLCIALVLFAELVNTALEALVDLVSPEIHPLAKIAKDVAAASVLVLAFAAFIIGVLIFIPYITLWI